MKATKDWQDAHRPLTGLPTDQVHEVTVEREAIPIIFVPGIMGSQLRRGGSGAADPDMRWNLNSISWTLRFLTRQAASRKERMIGAAFSPSYLEVDNAEPYGDGRRGIHDGYYGFLDALRTHYWGPLGRMYVFPVYAAGYNWTDDNKNSGKKLTDRITAIKAECAKVVGIGRCEKVILVTHSMGGLVARAACEQGAKGDVIGIVHGVQPVHGAPAAFWRIKAGFEAGGFKDKVASTLLGSSGREVTTILANAPGGLQLLPSQNYVTNSGNKAWLEVDSVDPGQAPLKLPQYGDPYSEIYSIPARPNDWHAGRGSGNFWGLVDPDLLDPGRVMKEPTEPLEVRACTLVPATAAWAAFEANLKIAKAFHATYGTARHDVTHTFRGSGLATADHIHLKAAAVEYDHYPEAGISVSKPCYGTRDFRGYLTGPDGKIASLRLQPSALGTDAPGIFGRVDEGDGTVPMSSAAAIVGKGPPADEPFIGVHHQPAYDPGEYALSHEWVIAAIHALIKTHFDKAPA